ncbi:uncharacterized protein M421DRAFT_426669, partial [Didymella exigua CBS 183.55]
MAQPTYRDPTTVLRDQADWTGWLAQLQARCLSRNIWDKINPKTTTPLLSKPLSPRALTITNYAPAANTDIPLRPTKLLTTGQKAFKEDLEYYKHIIVFIQLTVSPHLLRTCCLPEKPLRQWITDLQLTVGVDEQIKQEQAQDRYLSALKPMRSTSQWDTWLAEYDQAATEAETYKVTELSQLNVITKDFLTAVNRVAPMWATSFQDSRRFKSSISQKEIIKRYQEHIIINHPLRLGWHKAFVADNAVFLAKGAGRKTTTLKRPSDQEPASTGGAKCPACGQRHSIRDCYYVNQDRAP